MLHGKEIDTRFYYCEVDGCDWRYSSKRIPTMSVGFSSGEDEVDLEGLRRRLQKKNEGPGIEAI
jgi:hypothetical protein